MGPGSGEGSAVSAARTGRRAIGFLAAAVQDRFVGGAGKTDTAGAQET